MSYKNTPFEVFLGTTKRNPEPVFLNGFEWQCGWYWAGGYIGNKNFHAHFDETFLEVPDIRGHVLGNFITPWTRLPDHIKKEDCVVVSNGCSVWEPIETFLTGTPEHIVRNWWRIKDLYKQFYALKAAAEVFRLGGNCALTGRNPAEIAPELEKKVNDHIYSVIIPEIVIALGVGV